MLEVQSLDRMRRKEASRRLAWQSLLLCLVVVLAMAVAGTSKVEPNGVTPSVVADLKDKNERQADELDRWRQRFAYCKTAGNWTDVRCADPSASVGSIQVGERRTVVRGTNDDDDDDGGDTTVVVRPKESPPSKEPDPTNPPDPNAPVGDLTEQVEETVKDVTDNLPDVAANQ